MDSGDFHRYESRTMCRVEGSIIFFNNDKKFSKLNCFSLRINLFNWLIDFIEMIIVVILLL